MIRAEITNGTNWKFVFIEAETVNYLLLQKQIKEILPDYKLMSIYLIE